MHRRIVALRSKGRFGIPRLVDAIEAVEAIRGGAQLARARVPPSRRAGVSARPYDAGGPDARRATPRAGRRPLSRNSRRRRTPRVPTPSVQGPDSTRCGADERAPRGRILSVSVHLRTGGGRTGGGGGHHPVRPQRRGLTAIDAASVSATTSTLGVVADTEIRVPDPAGSVSAQTSKSFVVADTKGRTGVGTGGRTVGTGCQELARWATARSATSRMILASWKSLGV